MGAGNSLGGGKAVMAGTYMAEQMSPEQCTLFSTTAGAPKKRVVNDPKAKRKNFNSLEQNSNGCTILPALEAIDPLLTPDETEGPLRPRKGGPSRVEAAPKKGPRRKGGPSRIGGIAETSTEGKFEDALLQPSDKSNDDLVAWLTRPKDDRSRKPMHNVSSASHASTGDSPRSNNSSPRHGVTSREASPSQRHSRSVSSHKTYDELFATALQGCNNISHSRTKTYMPGKTGQRLRPLVGQIQPIHILPENPVEAFWCSDREKVRAQKALLGLNGDKKDKNRNHVVSKALTKFKTGQNPQVPAEPVIERGPSKPANDLGARLSSVVDALGTPGLKDEVKKDGGAEDGNIEVVSSNSKMPQMRKEASEALRLFVFGAQSLLPQRIPPYDEAANKAIDKERDQLFYQTTGSKREVIMLEKMWRQLDDDDSGRVNIQEFRAFAMKTGTTLQKLSEKVVGPLLGKKSSFTIEDMMRIIWPCATLQDVKSMKKWIDSYHQNVKAVPAPATIKHEELQALVHNFKFFDQDSSGQVTFKELTESGLLDKDMADRYMKEWDDDGSGELDQMEFCEMFCMAGYRVHPEARRATDNDGNRLVYEECIGWHRRDEWEAFIKGVSLKGVPL